MLLFRAAVARRRTQWLLIGTAALLAGLLQNLTMVAGILIVAALLLRHASLVFAMLIVAIGAFTLDITYYSERLTLSPDSANFSVLVFLQGWENAVLNFQETHGLGVGFQQFGIAGSVGEIADKIAAMLEGDYINLLDGGSTATKLIGEFGVFGIAALLAYFTVVLRGVAYIRAAQRRPAAERDYRRIFFYSLIISYTFELTIRGVGYFSSGGFLAVAALIAIYRSRKSQEAATHKGGRRDGQGAVVAEDRSPKTATPDAVAT
jgi:hypothetical protein